MDESRCCCKTKRQSKHKHKRRNHWVLSDVQHESTSDNETDKTAGQPSMTSLICWNIKRVLHKNPDIDLKDALESTYAKLEQNAYDLTLTPRNANERHLTCALLAWQALGEKDVGDLYEYVANLPGSSDSSCASDKNDSSKASEKSVDRFSVKSVGGILAKNSNRSSAKGLNSSLNKSVNRNSDKSVDRSSDKSVDRSLDKSVNRNSEKNINRNPNKSVNRSTSSTVYIRRSIRGSDNEVSDRESESRVPDGESENRTSESIDRVSGKSEDASYRQNKFAKKRSAWDSVTESSSTNTESEGVSHHPRRCRPASKLSTESKVVMRVANPCGTKANIKVPKHVMDQVDAACCMKSSCASRLKTFNNTVRKLRQRAVRLAQRESERTELLERAETAWRDLDRGYQRRINLAKEKEDDISRQTQKLIGERNGYKQACSHLAQLLRKRGELTKQERAKLTIIEKQLCDRACERHKLAEEEARGDAAFANQQCEAAQIERDLQFREEQARRKALAMKNTAELTRALTIETERAVRSELGSLRDQIKKHTAELQKLEKEEDLIMKRINEMSPEKENLLKELNDCKSSLDDSVQSKVDELKDKKTKLAELKDKVLECRCKLPIDTGVEVKRSPSIAALCQCDPDDIEESCSCTSLRSRLMSDFLADLFSGLQSEMCGAGVTMPCSLLKCLDDQHNWDRASNVKTHLTNYFSKLLVGELDIAIATSIEKYRAKWVGGTCLDSPPSVDYDENQNNLTERHTQEFATKLAEQLFREHAEKLIIERTKEMMNGPKSPPADNHHGSSTAVYTAQFRLNQAPDRPLTVTDASTASAVSGFPGYWRHTHNYITQLRVEIDDLKKDTIKKEDLQLVQDNLKKIVKKATNSTRLFKQKNVSPDKLDSIIENQTSKFEVKDLENKLNQEVNKKNAITPNKNISKQTVLKKKSEKPVKNIGQTFRIKGIRGGQVCMRSSHKTNLLQNVQLRKEDRSSWTHKPDDIISQMPHRKKSKSIKFTFPQEIPEKENIKSSEYSHYNCVWSHKSFNYESNFSTSELESKSFKDNQSLKKASLYGELVPIKKNLKYEKKLLFHNNFDLINLSSSNEKIFKSDNDRINRNIANLQLNYKTTSAACTSSAAAIKLPRIARTTNSKEYLKPLIKNHNEHLTQVRDFLSKDNEKNTRNVITCERDIRNNNKEGVILVEMSQNVHEENKSSRNLSKETYFSDTPYINHEVKEKNLPTELNNNTKANININTSKKSQDQAKNLEEERPYQDYLSDIPVKLTDTTNNSKENDLKITFINNNNFCASKSCICSTYNNIDEYNELEKNTFQLLEQHLTEKLRKFKSVSSKSSCIPPEEENKLLSYMLNKIKKVVSDDATKINYKYQDEIRLESSWQRAYILLQEYIKSKIKRAQYICKTTDSVDETKLSNLLSKVCNMIENDFEKLKSICTYENNGTIFSKPSIKADNKNYTHITSNTEEIMLANNDKTTNSKALNVDTSAHTMSRKLSRQFSPEKMDDISNKTMDNKIPIYDCNRAYTNFSCSPMVIDRACSCDSDLQGFFLRQQYSNRNNLQLKSNLMKSELFGTKTQFTDKILNSKSEQKLTYYGIQRENKDCNKNNKLVNNCGEANVTLTSKFEIDEPYIEEQCQGITNNVICRSSVPYIGFTLECSCDRRLGPCVCPRGVLINKLEEVKTTWNRAIPNKDFPLNLLYVMSNQSRKTSNGTVFSIKFEDMSNDSGGLYKRCNDECHIVRTTGVGGELICNDDIILKRSSTKIYDMASRTTNTRSLIEKGHSAGVQGSYPEYFTENSNSFIYRNIFSTSSTRTSFFEDLRSEIF